MNNNYKNYDKYNCFIDYVSKFNLGEVLINESLKKYTTLRIGGNAFCVYKPDNLDNLRKAYNFIIRNNLDFFVLGNGSNLLISDDNHQKIFISLKKLNNVVLKKNILNVEAGASSPVVAKGVSRLGYSGLEFLAGIPATFGGIIYMNAGAQNKAISDCLESVTYLDEFGNLCEMVNINDKGFNYRTSPFQKRKVIIVSCKIKLNLCKNESSPLEIFNSYLQKKKETQPLNAFSAGCAFKNHYTTPAWKLIEGAGCSNLSINSASVSKIHHNFLVNNNNATFKDMYELLLLIQNEVYEKYQIKLEFEWCIIK